MDENATAIVTKTLTIKSIDTHRTRLFTEVNSNYNTVNNVLYNLCVPWAAGE